MINAKRTVFFLAFILKPLSFPKCPCGSVVEHTLGKGEVTSSILVTGSLLQRLSTSKNRTSGPSLSQV